MEDGIIKFGTAHYKMDQNIGFTDFSENCRDHAL